MFDPNYIFYIGLPLVILIFSMWFFTLTRRRKSNLQLILAQFGTNVVVKAGISSFEIQVERDGTLFSGSSVTTTHSTIFRLNFYLPHFDEKFLIRQNSYVADIRASVDEGQFSSAVSIPRLPDNYVVLSPNSNFSKTFLSNKTVLAEIHLLDSKFTYPQVWFEDGKFQIELLSASGWNVVEKFRYICHAAIVFHDCIKTFSKN